MCKFFSAVVKPDGTLLWSAVSDSHEDIIEANDMLDDGSAKFCRLEYLPGVDPLNINQYKLNIDQEKPRWLTDRKLDNVEEKLKALVKSFIIKSGHKRLLLGGRWLLGGTAKIDKIKSAFVHIISDSAKVDSISGSAKVGSISDSAKVGYIYGSAKVDSIHGSAKVDYISGSAKVDSISDSAKVDYISGSAKVDYISDSAKIINDNRN